MFIWYVWYIIDYHDNVVSFRIQSNPIYEITIEHYINL